MYTWGYIKDNVLGKLNIDEEEANRLGFLSRFPYYANESMTQICSAIKPKDSFFLVNITNENINKPIQMPDDFVAFDDDVVIMTLLSGDEVEATDAELEYYGYNNIICKCLGIYRIPYQARWFFFTKDLQDSTVIPAPADICDSITLYMVTQCYKIDDEIKAAIYRNEYEMALARINDSTFKSQRTFHIGGGW